MSTTAEVSTLRPGSRRGASIRDRIRADHGPIDVGIDRQVAGDGWSAAVVAHYDSGAGSIDIDIYQGFGLRSWTVPIRPDDLAAHPDATGAVAALLAEHGLPAADLLASLSRHEPLRLGSAVSSARLALAQTP